MTDQSSSPTLYSDERVTNFELRSLRSLMDSDLPRIEWVVDQLIPGGSISCVAGRPKVGKSFVILELAMSIASGEPLFGRFEVVPKKVLLISKEDNFIVLKERLSEMDIDPDLEISITTDQDIYLDNDEVLPTIRNLIAQSGAEVVIIDSFIRIFRGEENSSKDVTRVHRVFKRLCDEGISVIFVHHHGKEDANKPKSTGDKLRGSSDLLAMLDSLVTVEKGDNDQILIFRNTHNRHAKGIRPFYVSFPSFSGDDKRFHFLNFVDSQSVEDSIPPIDIASSEVLALLTNGNQMYQADIVHNLLSVRKPYGEATIKRAIKRLVTTRRLSTTVDTSRKLYSIPGTVGVEAQSPVEVEA